MESDEVLISYSHDSEEHIYRVIGLSERLRSDGVNIMLDAHHSDPQEGWPQWMLNKITNSKNILAICTRIYYQRAHGEEEKGKGQGVKWETRLIYQRIYDSDSESANVIPVIFKESDKKYIPLPLKAASYFDLSKPSGYDDLYRRLTDQPLHSASPLGKLKMLPPKSIVSYPSANGDILPQIIRDNTVSSINPKVQNATRLLDFLNYDYSSEEEASCVEFLNEFIEQFQRIPQSSRELAGIMAERSILLGYSPILGSDKVEVNLNDLQEACGLTDDVLSKHLNILEEHKLIDFWPEEWELKLRSYNGWNILFDLAKYCQHHNLKMHLFTTELNFKILDA
jgi:DNA-binding transcriptional ArsR family regulator